MLPRGLLKFVASCLLVTHAGTAFGIDRTPSEKLERLNGDMKSLHEHERDSRWIGAGFLGAFGLVYGASAIGAKHKSDRNSDLWMSAGFLGIGSLVYFLPTRSERLTEEFITPSSESESARIERGERYLGEVRDSSRTDRLIAGTVLGLTGVLYLAQANSNEDRTTELSFNISNGLHLLMGLAFGIGSITTFLLPTEAEETYDRYHDWMKQKPVAYDWNLRFAPTPQTPIAANFNLSF